MRILILFLESTGNCLCYCGEPGGGKISQARVNANMLQVLLGNTHHWTSLKKTTRISIDAS
jgi:hypothetical protein